MSIETNPSNVRLRRGHSPGQPKDCAPPALKGALELSGKFYIDVAVHPLPRGSALPYKLLRKS